MLLDVHAQCFFLFYMNLPDSRATDRTMIPNVFQRRLIFAWFAENRKLRMTVVCIGLWFYNTYRICCSIAALCFKFVEHRLQVNVFFGNRWFCLWRFRRCDSCSGHGLISQRWGRYTKRLRLHCIELRLRQLSLERWPVASVYANWLRCHRWYERWILIWCRRCIIVSVTILSISLSRWLAAGQWARNYIVMCSIDRRCACLWSCG